MISAHEIRKKLALVADGELSLDAFEDWFVPNSWNMHKDSSLDAIDLASSIHHLLSERNERILSKSELRGELLEHVGYRIQMVNSGVTSEQINYYASPAQQSQFNQPIFQPSLHSSLVRAFAQL
jgi:hypothetical protein